MKTFIKPEKSNFKVIRKHIYKSPAYILAWIGFIIGISVIAWSFCLKFVPDLNKHPIYTNVIAQLWFANLQFFTIQTNILLVVFYFLWIVALKTKIFNTNKFLIFTTSYIILVFTVAWFMMSPIFVLQGTNPAGKLDSIETILVHLLTPVLFVVFAIFAMKYPRPDIKRTLKFWTNLAFAFIYPLIYFTYVVAINFIAMPSSIFMEPYASQLSYGYSYVSVYSLLTDYNPKCFIPIWDSSSSTWNFFPGGSPSDPTSDSWNSGKEWRLFTVPIIYIYFALDFLILVYINNRQNNRYKIAKQSKKIFIY